MLCTLPEPAIISRKRPTLPCIHQHKASPNSFGLAQENSRLLLARYALHHLNKVSSTTSTSRREEVSISNSLLASQTRQPHHTSDAGPTSTSDSQPETNMVGTLRRHSNNAVTRTQPKASQVYTTIAIRVQKLCHTECLKIGAA